MAGYCDPPNRFSSTNQPKRRGGPRGPMLVPLLRKFLEKKITYEDPETQKLINGKVKDAILWRLILNATQGENHAIKEILDRIDGKVAESIKIEKEDEAIGAELQFLGIPKNGAGKHRFEKFLK